MGDLSQYLHWKQPLDKLLSTRNPQARALWPTLYTFDSSEPLWLLSESLRVGPVDFEVPSLREGVRRAVRLPIEMLITPSHTSWPVVCNSDRTGLKRCLYVSVFSSQSCNVLKDTPPLVNSYIF